MSRETELLDAVLPYKPKVETPEDLKRARDDWRIFGGWYTTLKLKGKFKYSKDEILTTFLIPCLRELIKEGSTEFHPEGWKKYAKEIYLEAFGKVVTRFRYLVAPHAELIYKGRKTATVHARKFIQGSFVSIVGPKYEYGFARFVEGVVVDITAFGNLSSKHRILPGERKKWWPDKKELYYYAIRTWIPLDKPRKVRVPKGIQTYGARKSLTESSLPDFEYLTHHIVVGKKGEERIHHCFFLDHLGNLYTQAHLLVKNGKVFVDEKEVKEGVFHFIVSLESEQEVAWSDEQAEKAGIRPKKMEGGMTLAKKAKEW